MFTTKNSKETQMLGKMLAEEFKNGGVIALEGELGSGKTTFTQGFLKGLKAEGPYTSPTFIVMKHYNITCNIKHETKFKIQNAYHIDAYRVKAKDTLSLGWDEIVADKNNVIIVEWADRIRKIIPAQAIWIKFKWVEEKKRKIIFRK